ncbi:hypothetical protein D9758_011394 [Tetrapyrgos nigripes]|uniref:RRM domain-containing protein n=1 Tax=Tetrapyrgos nigripes TaxID=182062 RepID=A0A8H5FRA5_9AGAR|nr:hypothetical protein D9758_011394 [Tetrapyrgos nigripes]
MNPPPSAPARYRSFHGPKRQLVGNHAGQVPPAWRPTGPYPTGPRNTNNKGGSKILLSQLPFDVGEKEVEELFKKTVGPLKESFLIYNSQGKSKGMAVVSFQKTEDAAMAKAKYDGKFVDGRRPIKIEIITDKTPSSSGSAPTEPAPPPSLIDRIQGRGNANPVPSAKKHSLPRQEAAVAAMMASSSFTPLNVTPNPDSTQSTHRRYKKGPKRLKKQTVQFVKVHPTHVNGTTKPKVAGKSKDDLDQEMDDYRAMGEQV